MKYKLLISDFGTAKKLEQSNFSFSGSQFYMAPEIFDPTQKYGLKVDM